VIPGQALVSSLVIARRARHHLLQIASFDILEKARGYVPSESRRLSPVVRDDDVVATLPELEAGGIAHDVTVAGSANGRGWSTGSSRDVSVAR
jgi:hypothetical protein